MRLRAQYRVVTIPINVNVVPGDEAAGGIVDATVHTEVVFQEAQQGKRLASEALERGDRRTAKRLLGEAAASLGPSLPLRRTMLAPTSNSR